MEEPSAKRPRGPESRSTRDYKYTQRRSRSRSPRQNGEYRGGQDRRRERSIEADRDRNERRARKSEGARDSPQPPARGPRRDDPRAGPRDRDQDRKHARDRSPRRDRTERMDADRHRERARGDREGPRDPRASLEHRPPPAAAGRPTANPPRPNGVHKTEAKPERATNSIPNPKPEEDEEIDPDEDEVTRETRLMKRMLGFSKFKSTKNTKIPGNEKNYAVRKEKTTEYRQYMNRQGGFNRPLSPG